MSGHVILVNGIPIPVTQQVLDDACTDRPTMANDAEVTSYLICECTQCNVVWSFDWQESPCSCNTSDEAMQLSIDTQNLVEVEANSWREALMLYRSADVDTVNTSQGVLDFGGAS